MAGEEKTRRCVVLGGGPIKEEEIALDPAGGHHLGPRMPGCERRVASDCTPPSVWGTRDSCERPQRAEELICLPSEKDDTDTHYAARLLVQRGFREALLLGGIGGRLDHTLANLCTLLFLVRSGVSCWLVGQGAAVTALAKWDDAPAAPGKYLFFHLCGGWLSAGDHSGRDKIPAAGGGADRRVSSGGQQ